jgi:hypothetical protein
MIIMIIIMLLDNLNEITMISTITIIDCQYQ